MGPLLRDNERLIEDATQIELLFSKHISMVSKHEDGGVNLSSQVDGYDVIMYNIRTTRDIMVAISAMDSYAIIYLEEDQGGHKLVFKVIEEINGSDYLEVNEFVLEEDCMDDRRRLTINLTEEETDWEFTPEENKISGSIETRYTYKNLFDFIDSAMKRSGLL